MKEERMENPFDCYHQARFTSVSKSIGEPLPMSGTGIPSYESGFVI